MDFNYNPNPDIVNTIIAQPLSTSSKSKKYLTTNKVVTYFLDSLYTPSDCTLFRVSISGFGYNKTPSQYKQVPIQTITLVLIHPLK